LTILYHKLKSASDKPGYVVTNEIRNYCIFMTSFTLHC